MLDAVIKDSMLNSEMVLAEQLEHQHSRIRWSDKNRQFQLSGEHLTETPGLNLHLDP